MNKNYYLKIIIFGILQWIALNVVIFAVALAFGIKESTEITAPPPLGMAIVAVIYTVIAYLFGRWLKPTGRKQAIIAGLIWSGITTVIMLVTLFANDTQGVFLKNWTAYFIFIAQFIGMMFVGGNRSGLSSQAQ